MRIATVLAAGAALALAGCGKSETAATDAVTPPAEASAASEAAAVPAAATPAVAAAAGKVPTKDFMVGKWGEGGDCQLAIEFKADGSMVGPFEKWELDNGVLTMVGNPQKMHLTVVDQDTMESKLDGTGSPRKLSRCK